MEVSEEARFWSFFLSASSAARLEGKSARAANEQGGTHPHPHPLSSPGGSHASRPGGGRVGQEAVRGAGGACAKNLTLSLSLRFLSRQAADARAAAVAEVGRLMQHPEHLRRLPDLRAEYEAKRAVRERESREGGSVFFAPSPPLSSPSSLSHPLSPSLSSSPTPPACPRPSPPTWTPSAPGPPAWTTPPAPWPACASATASSTARAGPRPTWSPAPTRSRRWRPRTRPPRTRWRGRRRWPPCLPRRRGRRPCWRAGPAWRPCTSAWPPWRGRPPLRSGPSRRPPGASAQLRRRSRRRPRRPRRPPTAASARQTRPPRHTPTPPATAWPPTWTASAGRGASLRTACGRPCVPFAPWAAPGRPPWWTRPWSSRPRRRWTRPWRRRARARPAPNGGGPGRRPRSPWPSRTRPPRSSPPAPAWAGVRAASPSTRRPPCRPSWARPRPLWWTWRPCPTMRPPASPGGMPSSARPRPPCTTACRPPWRPWPPRRAGACPTPTS